MNDNPTYLIIKESNGNPKPGTADWQTTYTSITEAIEHAHKIAEEGFNVTVVSVRTESFNTIWNCQWSKENDSRDSDYLTFAETADVLNVSKYTLAKLVNNKTLKPFQRDFSAAFAFLTFDHSAVDKFSERLEMFREESSIAWGENPHSVELISTGE